MRKETIQSEGSPQDWPSISPLNWKWLDDVRLLLQGREGRQNFINTLTDAQPNNAKTSTFFINDSQGNAYFLRSGNFPSIDGSGNFIVPTTIIASRREILNVGAVNAYISGGQLISNNLDTILAFDTVEFDEDSTMVLGTWTPKQAGKYSVTAQVSYTNPVADKFSLIYLTKNGSTQAGAQSQSSIAQILSTSVSKTIEMNGTTDYMNVVVKHNFGGASATIAGNTATYFSAYKVN